MENLSKKSKFTHRNRSRVKVSSIHKLNKKPTNRFSFYKIGLILLFIGFCILFAYTRYKAFKDPISVLTRLENGDVAILVYNPKDRSLNTFVIDKNTQVDLSRNLGKIRLKGVWQLSQNEGLDGVLLLETIVKNFKLPISFWADEDLLDLVKSNPLKSVKSLIIPLESNLNLSQRIKLLQLGLFLPTAKNNIIYLKDTSYLSESVLDDGENGYLISDKAPNFITILFVNPEFSKKPSNFAIINKSGNFQIESFIAEIFEVYGAKLVSVNRENGKGNEDCTFYLNDKSRYEPFIDIYGCSIKKNDAYKSIDMVMEIGDKFVERF